MLFPMWFRRLLIVRKENLEVANYLQGQGYSLPADVQYVDTRWEVPVVLPLRDCLAQELSLLCELDR
jgi:hypothetical protein